MQIKNSEKKIHRKKLKHYDIPGHAHELTFSCYHQLNYLKDPACCKIFMEELSLAREKFQFQLWAYVLMPNHVHLLIYPCKHDYKISIILQSIKGRTSKHYGDKLLAEKPKVYEKYCIKVGQKKTFRFWKAGGGYDRNLWNAKAIHASIKYIEENPVRAGLVESTEEWKWSSARARFYNEGLVPDDFNIPILMK